MSTTRILIAVTLAGCGVDVRHDSSLCERGKRDVVSRSACADPAPALGGLADVERLFRVQPDAPGIDRALLSHTTSLVTRIVSPLNPRALLFPHDGLGGDRVALGFTRGEQLVELVDRDPDTQELAFFLLTFKQACNVEGCTNADLFSPRIESGWTEVTIAADEDLKNTPLDCLQCHQPDGPGTPKILRMQELTTPWTHFMSEPPVESSDDRQHIDDVFLAAHGSEDYAGYPSAQLLVDSPQVLEDFVEHEGFSAQPNAFVSKFIEAEVGASLDGQSPTWHGLYDRARAGAAIPVPFRRNNAADPERLAAAAAAYQAWTTGAPIDDVALDLGQLIAGDAARDTGMQPELGADGATILAQMCERCHNSRLDQTLTRARFDVEDIDRTPGERQVAVERLMLPSSSPRKMPPPRFGVLSDDEIARAVTALQAR
jgi:hypothetical protein